MSSPKYITFMKKNSNIVYCIIFDELIQHSEMASKFEDINIISAGFFDICENNEIFVFGKSDSLNISSNPSDVKLINKTLNL